MFPQLDVAVAKLSQCQRVALFDYDESSNLINLRHYAITAEPVGVSRNLRRLLLRKKVDGEHCDTRLGVVERSSEQPSELTMINGDGCACRFRT